MTNCPYCHLFFFCCFPCPACCCSFPSPPAASILFSAAVPLTPDPASADLPPPLFYGAPIPFLDDSDSDSNNNNDAVPPLLPSKYIDYDSNSDSDDADASPSLASLPSTPPTRAFVIEVPPKIWRPKPIDRYIPMDYSNDINDSVFEFQQFGNAICHLPRTFYKCSNRYSFVGAQPS